MTKAELSRRIEELERRVRELEARPVYVPVFPQPVVVPPPYPGFTQPWQLPQVWCGTASPASSGPMVVS